MHRSQVYIKGSKFSTTVFTVEIVRTDSTISRQTAAFNQAVDPKLNNQKLLKFKSSTITLHPSMQVPIVFSDTPTVIDKLFIEKKLSDGNFDVYQTFCPKYNAKYALKIFPRTDYGTSQYCKEQLMTKLNHPNIIKCIPTVNVNDKFYALVTEFAELGNFLDIVRGDLLNHEAIVRTYFHQLIEGLEHMHSQGVAHLDLKLENLMMGSDFLLKIIDFDQAQLTSDKCITSGGTVGFRAPELRNRTGESPAAVDVYSAGFILFTFLAKDLPFLENEDPVNKDERTYSFFCNQNDKFWENKTKRFGNKGLFSQEFIRLVNGMLLSDPEKRLKIQDIKNSSWYKGPVLDIESLKIVMKSRFESLKKTK